MDLENAAYFLIGVVLGGTLIFWYHLLVIKKLNEDLKETLSKLTPTVMDNQKTGRYPSALPPNTEVEPIDPHENI